MMRNIYFIVLAIIAVSCGGPDVVDMNQQYVALENGIREGKFDDFDEAEHTLDSLLTICNNEVAKLEFASEEQERAQAENYKKVILKITKKKIELQTEKELYKSITATGNRYRTIIGYKHYAKAFPEGLMTKSLEASSKMVANELIDELTQRIQKNSQEVTPTNSEKNIYNFADYVYSEVTTGLSDSLKAQDTDQAGLDFDTQILRIGQIREALQDVFADLPYEIETSNGNTPQTLREQFNTYENHLREMKEKGKAMMKHLVIETLRKTNWEQQAKNEIEAKIYRERGGWSTCDVNYLTNTITQAQDYNVLLLSDKIEVGLVYNASSYCANNLKYKYYTGNFTLVFPVIDGRLGEGYFKDNNIIQTN